MKYDLDSWGRKVNYKHTYNFELFHNKNSLFYYLLGAFISDGNIYFGKNNKNAQASLSSNDLDWLIMINNVISKSNLISTNKKGNVLRVYSKEIAEIFHTSGCIPNKSLTVKFPQVPDIFLPDFIRGCMDGDGSISLPEKTIKRPYGIYKYIIPTCYLCSASKDFLDVLSEKLNQLEFKHYFITLHPKKRKINNKIISNTNPMYRLLFNNKDCHSFLNWTYYNNDNISMPRKYKIIQQINNHIESKR